MSEYAWQTDPITGRQTYRRVRKPEERRAGPAFVRDDCDVVSMVDGKRYTSKAALRRSYREQGYVEVGDQTDYVMRQPDPPEPKGVRESVEKALVRAGIIN